MFGFIKNLLGSNDTQIITAINNGAYLVDVRTSGEFSGGSVKGAVNIPLDSITSQITKFKGKKEIVVFCQSGMRSSQAKTILEQNGINNVINGGSWHKVSQLKNK